MWNQLKTVLLLGALSAVLVGIGGALGQGYLYLFLGLAIALNVGTYFFSDRLVLRMHRARELSEAEAPRLHAMVAELAGRTGIPKPRVYYVADPQPNAFATGRNPAHGVVAVTDGILQLLTERELRGVLAHELGHIKNRDILVSTVAATIAAAVTYIAHAVQFAAIFGFGGQDDEEGPSPLAALALAIVAPIAATLVQLGISRAREYLADQQGAEISGDPEALASALEKLGRASGRIPSAHAEPSTASLMIANPLSGRGGVMHLFSTHPPMEERIRRLRAAAHGRGGHAWQPRFGRSAS